MNSTIKYYSFYLLILLGFSCKKDEKQDVNTSLPSIETLGVVSRFGTTAILKGSLIAQGGSDITEKGIVYSTNSKPENQDQKIIIKSKSISLGAYQDTITIDKGLTYYFKAYAINKYGTVYGKEDTLKIGLPSVVISIPFSGNTSWTLSGKIVSDGGGNVSESGVFFSDKREGLTEDNKISGSGIDSKGEFSILIPNLQLEKKYYFRPFTRNEKGINLGPIGFFSTPVLDKDSLYQTACLENQMWMKSDLRRSVYNDGSPISKIEIDSNWVKAKEGSYFTTTKRNFLYNSYAIVSPKGLCPPGWKLPNDQDWINLMDPLGGWEVSGTVLKQAGVNSFSASFGGVKDPNGSVRLLDSFGYYWISTTDTNSLNVRSINDLEKGFYLYPVSKGTGASVRCFKEILN